MPLELIPQFGYSWANEIQASSLRYCVRILVTGGAGFVGSNLLKRLSEQGHQTLALDDFSSGSWTNLVDYRGDILTHDVAMGVEPLKAAGPFDVILHQASITDTT